MAEKQKWLSPIQNLVEQATSRPSWDEYFMAIALLLSARSSCPRLKVGCVLVTGIGNKNRLIAAGYNGFLPGLPHVSKLREGHEQATVHAEQNTIADAARRGVTVQNSIAYITHFPCINCAKLLLSSGIQRCFFNVDYNNDPLVSELFQEANIPIQKL